MKQRLITWLAATSITLAVTGCSAGDGNNKDPYPYTKLPRNFSQSTVGVVTIHAIGTGQPDTALWSPSGSTFAFTVDAQKGTAVIGTASSLQTSQVNLGNGRTIVSLTDNYAVVTSWSADQDWLYPIEGASLGQPKTWAAPTDTWQEWVNTAKGPAIVTGGYKPNSVAITLSDGITTRLEGGQVYTSIDGSYGAVVSGTRMKRLVHPVGDVMDPSEFQSSPATDPVAVWDFDFAGGPRKRSTVHLPSADLPKEAGPGELQSVQFSPNDKYVAVLVDGEYGTGPKSYGKTFIFATASGRLVGTAPYGNGMKWASDSKSLWLGTAMPEGQGTDRIVDVHGHTVWSWKDSMNRLVVTPISSTSLLVVDHNQLAVWNKKVGVEPFNEVGNLQGSTLSLLAPGGAAALVNLWGPVIYTTW